MDDITTTAGQALDRLHHDETGAQAMEYTALACAGVGITGLVIELLNSDVVQSRLAELFTGIVDSLGGALGGLF
ncbi:hypothetical protein [Euzebya sp.]|uniref:hypothetical protein n=1 Tax=Euzebya sp. TaxID=1971409 RepID=UPI003512DCE6